MLLPLLPLLLAQAAASSVLVRFESQLGLCPTEAQRAQLRRLTSGGSVSMQACTVECAAALNCSAVHRSQTAAASDCYLAARSDWEDAWPTVSSGCYGNAVSLVRLPVASAALSDQLVAWLSLRVSLGNLANASAPPASLAGPGATRNSSGVALPGNGDSYIRLPPPEGVAGGLEDRRGLQGQFSMYVKAEWFPGVTNSTYLVRAASLTNTVTMWLYEEARCFKFGNRRAQTSNYMTGPVAPSTKSIISVGIAFSAGTYTVFVNGNPEPVTSYSTLSSTTAVGTDLRLGAKHAQTDEALNGRFICFAYWARALSREEFAEFDKLC